MSRRRCVVMKSWRDAGPTVAVGWRLWEGSVEDRTIHEHYSDAEGWMGPFRRRLEAVGLVVTDVHGEPVCEHDLSDYEDPSDHFNYGDCDQTFMCARVRVPARDPQHAYEQTCRALGVDPDGEACAYPNRAGLTSIRVAKS